MKVLLLTFMAVSLFSEKGFCTDSMNFSDEDLKKFSKTTQPQRTRDIKGINQKTDVIYFKKSTVPTNNSGMEEYITYNEPSRSLRTIRALSSQKVIDQIELLERNDKIINVINLVDNYMVDDGILSYLKDNVQSLTFLNVQNTRVTESSIREFKIQRPSVKVIY